MNPAGPPRTDTTEFTIQTQGAPISVPPFRVSQKESEVIWKHLDEMLKNNVIRVSTSPWAAPVVLAPKKDGSLRFCVDYRKLNVVTTREIYPIPRIDDTINSLSGQLIFSTMDCAAGYWQIPIKESDKEKTAFITKFGLYEFNVLPFGLTNAPAFFQRTMDLVLAGLKWQICLVYMDDIVVFSRTLPEHLQRLQSVFQALRKHWISLKMMKCHWAMRQIKFLGHLVDQEGIQPDPTKLEAMRKLPPPRNVHELRSFLGLVGVYRKFVPAFADIAGPLYNRLTKNKLYHWEWTEACQESFELLKASMLSHPVLAHPNSEHPFRLRTDASNTGIGAVLTQLDGEENERVVAYYSRVFNAAQRNYSTTERECLAVIAAIEHFRPFLFGQNFTVITDHSSLQWLWKHQSPNGRLMRWVLRLQPYSFAIEHRPGTTMGDADALSRQSTSPELMTDELDSDQMDANNFALIASIATSTSRKTLKHAKQRLSEPAYDPLRELREEQLNDPELKQFYELAATDWTDGKSTFCVEQGILYRIYLPKRSTLIPHEPANQNDATDESAEPQAAVIPQSLRDVILELCHDSLMAGHLGVAKTTKLVLSRYWWPHVTRDIKAWVETCPNCQSFKQPRTKLGLLQHLPIPQKPFHTLGVDFVGPLPMTNSGNKYLLVFVDHLTRWPEVFATATDDAEIVAKILVEQIICHYGAPAKILSDRGKAFIGKLMAFVYRYMGIHKINTTAYHPQCDGLVEGFNKTLKRMLAIMASQNQRDWDVYVPYAMMAYWNAVHESTKFTPFELVFGMQARLPADVRMVPETIRGLKYEDYRAQLTKRMNEMQGLAIKNLQAAHQRNDKYYNLKRVGLKFEPGQLVWLFTPETKPGRAKKLTPRWKGPYLILEHFNEVNYVIVPVANPEMAPIGVHVSCLKTYRDPNAKPTEIPAEFLHHGPDGKIQEFIPNSEYFMDDDLPCDHKEIDEIEDH